MSTEQQFILSVLKDYITEQATDVPSNLDWDGVLRYAQNHQLQGIVYYQCKEFFEKHPDLSIYFSRLKTIYLQSIYCAKTREYLLNQVNRKFDENGICHFVIKGERIAQYYKHPELRTMGDTDIVVDKRESAHDIMLLLGFDNISHILDREWQYIKNGHEIELHDRLVYKEAINDDVITLFLNSYSDYIVDGQLDSSFHFIFVLCHLRKHFMNSGVGLRQFVDIAVLIKNNERLRWDWIADKLKEINMLEFAMVVCAYIKQWFGIVAPIEEIKIDKDIYEISTNYIFSNGVFGFDNPDNANFMISNAIRKSKCKRLAMLLNIIRYIFPSYESIYPVDTYSYIRGKPLLLPIAWIKRIIKVIKNARINEGKQKVRKSFVSKEYLTKREKMFKNWGI